MIKDLQTLALISGVLGMGIACNLGMAIAIAVHQISIVDAVVCGGVALFCWACLLASILGCFEV
jgi:hypothetical protein